MKNNFCSIEDKYIKFWIDSLIKELMVDEASVALIEAKLKKIILNSNCLNDLLEEYYLLLEEEMATLMSKKITPSFQFGIKNKYFSFISYEGKFNGYEDSINIDSDTYYSFDSISKILTSVVIMMMVREGVISMDSTVNSYNSDFKLDASIKSILDFSACIQTDDRIDYFSKSDTIEMLKKCRENLVEKNNYKNYYQYNDIGYMILRLSIPDFLDRLDYILNIIDGNNLTYNNFNSDKLITGGRLGIENISPDPKGRDIIFPGHTGLYGNMMGLLNLFDTIFYTDKILSKEEMKELMRQPYFDPIVYDKLGNRALSKNGSYLYMAKIGGIYRKPDNIIDDNYDKMTSCDFSNLTTDKAKASTGACGSWVMGDDLFYKGLFGSYVGGILTNPYSYVRSGNFKDKVNAVRDTNLLVNDKGIICGSYSNSLNYYKEVIATSGILLELLTEYIKTFCREEFSDIKQISYVRSLKKNF